MSATPHVSSESTLTARYQTTIPAFVRNNLGLSKGDRIRYSLSDDNQIVLSRVDPDDNDPVIEEFLNFLAEDMSANPQRIQVVGTDLVTKLGSLVGDIEVDLEAPLPDEDE